MSSRLALIPGIAAAFVVMLAGFWLAEIIGRAILSAQGLAGGSSPVSGVPVAIVLGCCCATSCRFPPCSIRG